MVKREDKNIDNILWDEFGEDYILGLGGQIYDNADIICSIICAIEIPAHRRWDCF